MTRDRTAIRVVPAKDLPAAELARWSELQKGDPLLASPFFRPEFTLAVSRFREDAFTAVLERGGECVGFFPFQRDESGAGRPIGDQLSDYHSVIFQRGGDLDVRELIRCCHLREWRFDHLPLGQGIFDRFQAVETFSPVIELRDGHERYFQEFCPPSSEPQRKRRKLERELGPLSFQWHSADPAALRTLMEWKSRQYLKSGKRDNFGLAWVRDVVENLHGTQSEEFGGVLSVLHAGDRLLAVHFGLRSGSVLHSWFPAYDPAYAKYSPGLVLLLLITEQAARHRICSIDLGKGKAFYKERLTNHIVPLIEGVVPASAWRAAMRALRNNLKDQVRKVRAWAQHQTD